MPRENIAHCFPVVDVVLFDSHCDAIDTLSGRSVSNWNVTLNIWNMIRYLKDTGRR